MIKTLAARRNGIILIFKVNQKLGCHFSHPKVSILFAIRGIKLYNY